MRTALHLGFGSRAERLIASKRPLIERGGLANRGWKAIFSPLAVNDVEPLTAITMRHPGKPSRAFRFAPRAPLPLGPAIKWNARAMSIPAIMPADVQTARSLRYIRSLSTRTGGYMACSFAATLPVPRSASFVEKPTRSGQKGAIQTLPVRRAFAAATRNRLSEARRCDPPSPRRRRG